MPRFRLTVCVAATLAVFSAAAPASATGYWNLPSTFCQCMGVGWGAGYHAPFVLGPITCDGWCDHKEVRVPYSPAPAYAWYGHGDCGCYYSQPSRLESAVVPPPVSAPAPVSAIFEAPIER
jgi:hypothetical protein